MTYAIIDTLSYVSYCYIIFADIYVLYKKRMYFFFINNFYFNSILNIKDEKVIKNKYFI